MSCEWSNLHVLNHPVVASKVSRLRCKTTGTGEFRRLVGELALLLGVESSRDLSLHQVRIETPLAEMDAPFLAENVILVPVLRAGLGMVETLLPFFPDAHVGHIGMYRDEVTLQPVEYFCKMPKRLSESCVMVLDPMLATGGSAIMAVDYLKRQGAKRIKSLHILAAPQGAEALCQAHPDVEVYVAAMDQKLNEHGYILPGLGDAGDRLFGTL